MKKLMILFVLIFTVALVACSQDTQGTEDDNKDSKGTTAEANDNFPNKPIQLIVPYPAGGATDANARILEKNVSKYLPNEQKIVVKNQEGGSGTVGMASLANAKPDGYTIGLAPVGAVAIQPALGEAPYEVDDFESISRVYSYPLVLMVKSDAPWEDFDEWLEYVKQNPGEFSFAWPGINERIAMEDFNIAAEVETKNVAYTGYNDSAVAVMSGDVSGAVVDLSWAQDYIESGEDLRPLVVFSDHKLDTLNYGDAPLISDKGYDVGMDGFAGLLAPKGVPEEHLEILNEAFKKALEEPEVIEQFKKLGTNINYGDREELQNDIDNANEKSKKILKEIGMIE